jgi:hypothetical protein
MSDMDWIEREGRADTLDLAVVYRNLVDQDRHPDRRFVDTITIRESSRMGIVASHVEIIDTNTSELHHHAVKIESISKIPDSRGGGWDVTRTKTIWIEDRERDEIARLRDFLSVSRGQIPEAEGHYLVLRLDEGQRFTAEAYELIQLALSPDTAERLLAAFRAVGQDRSALDRFIDLATENPTATEAVTAALNIARFRNALFELKDLIRNDVREHEFQRLLQSNDWLFGSEYSERLLIRRLARDQEQDFVLRRTVDDYIEILEIKRTLGNQPLFAYDPSHESYYPSRALASVLGQVINYIERLDSNRLALLHEEDIDTNKIRAKIVIGRSGDANQLGALRNLNGHLHRIEVMTFDQLVSIGERVLEQLEGVISRTQESGQGTHHSWVDDAPPF